MNIKILSHKQRIDNLFKKIALVDPLDQGEWAKYLCVLTAGFIEESLRVLLTDYSLKTSSPNIQNYLENEFRYITNCKTERILEILRRFDNRWAEEFEEEILAKSPIDREIKDSLDGIVSNRHLIAHGKSVGIGFGTVANYYRYVIEAVIILEKTVK